MRRTGKAHSSPQSAGENNCSVPDLVKVRLYWLRVLVSQGYKNTKGQDWEGERRVMGTEFGHEYCGDGHNFC